MAILDKQLILSSAQAVPTDTTDTISTNVIDLSSVDANPGEGRQAFLTFEVAEGVTHAGALSITFKLWSHTTAAALSGTAALEFTVAKAGLTAGTVFRFGLPESLSRYVAVSYEASATTATAGKFNAYVSIP